MNGNHPKRRKDKYNPYSIFEKDGRYILSFKDGEGVEHTQEVDEHLYGLFNLFELEDLSHLNEWDRHIEHSELTEASLNKRALRQGESVEGSVFQNIDSELLYKAIAKLPEIQRRRLKLYFFEEMTYEEIAAMEGCTKRAIKFSVDIAIGRLKDLLKMF